MKAVVLRFSAMGDVALTAPAIHSALNLNKDLELILVSHPNWQPFFEGFPERLKFVAADLRGRHKGVLGLWRLAGDIKKNYSFDCVADLHGVLRSWILSRFLGKKCITIDKDRRGKRKLLRDRHESPALKPTLQRYLDVFAQLGLNVSWPDNFCLPASSLGASGEDLSPPAIGVAPFSKHFTKNWPFPRVEELVQRLAEELHAQVYLFGGRGEEAERLQSLAENHEQVFSVAGKKTFSEELALMHQLDVVVAMDSGNMHLAALSGTKVLSIWGGTSPKAGFTPYASRPHRELGDDELDCRPCSIFGRAECPLGHFRCMKNIDIEKVLREIQSLLQER